MNRLDRLKVPPVLDPNELREQIEGEVAQATAPKADPKLAATYTFAFRYATPVRTFEGTFTNKILTVGERLRMGDLMARLLNGQTIDALPNDVTSLARAIAWMTFSLQGERPEWARNLATLEDESVIYALFAEVWSHQTTFLGRANDTEPKAANK